MTKLDEFVTIKEAAKFLGVSPNTIRNWHRDGKIPVYRSPISNYRLFKKKDLERLLGQIEDSGTYPSGWPNKALRGRKRRSRQNDDDPAHSAQGVIAATFKAFDN